MAIQPEAQFICDELISPIRRGDMTGTYGARFMGEVTLALVLVVVTLGALRSSSQSSTLPPLARPTKGTRAPHPESPPPQDGAKPVPGTKSQPTNRKYDDAARLFANQQYDQAARLAQECAQLEPENASCLKLAGDAYAALGKKDQATQMYVTFLRTAPDDPRAAEVDLAIKRLSNAPRPPPNASKDEEAQSAYADAAVLLKEKQYAEAVTRASRCVQLNPHNADCELVLGSAYAGLNQPDEAAKHYRRLLELAPDHRMAPKIRQTLDSYQKHKH